MNTYKLYGTPLISDDSTLKLFVNSVCANISLDGTSKEDPEVYEDTYMELLSTFLYDDLTRTDINCAELMFKYRYEIIDLIYDIQNNGSDTSVISFFGEPAKLYFFQLIEEYVRLHFYDTIF